MISSLAKRASRCRACGETCAIGSSIYNAEQTKEWFCSAKCAEEGPRRVTAEDVAKLAGAVAFRDKWRARCPAHKSHGLTLSIAQADSGGVLIRCFAGCEVSDIAAALNLELFNLAPREKNSFGSSTRHQRPPTADDVRAALTAEARVYRDRYHIDDGERLIAADVIKIRRTVSVQLGVSLPPVKRRVADSYAGGRERDPLWPVLLEQGWFESWIEYDGEPPCCSIDNFAAHGELGFRLLEIAEQRAVAEIRRVVAAATARERRSAA
jgi:hypothetical protein